MAFQIVFVLHGPSHEDPDHSELPALARRHGLALTSRTEAAGAAMALADLGFRAADGYRPYRGVFPSVSGASGFLAGELPLHEGIALLRHPDRYDPKLDRLLIDDAGLAEEMRAAGLAVLAVDPARPAGLTEALTAIAGADLSQEVEAEMFAEADPAARTLRHPVRADLLRPDAAPFPVVLGRAALIGGLTGDGTPLDAVEVIERLVALMGGAAFELTLTDAGPVAAGYETEGYAMELAVSEGAVPVGLDHPGPLVEMLQYFDTVDEMETDQPIEATVAAGVERVAREIGLCLAVEFPYDAAAGTLRGFLRDAKGGLVPVRLALDVEAGED